jgi:hypothetical protein
MARLPQPFLFSWNEIDAASDLERLRLVLEVVPDEPLMEVLEAERGRGRDDYPIRPVWNSILSGVVFGHESTASLRRELLRNGELRMACGFDPAGGADVVPPDWAYSRFLSCLLRHEKQVRTLFTKLVGALQKEFPDLGRYLAIDGKALSSFGRPRKKEKELRTRKDGHPDRRGETDADWGVKKYRGVRDGKPWEKVVSWFGFELHLLVDAKYEMPVNYRVTKASASETYKLLPMVKEAAERHPELIDRCEQLSADKGYDSVENIEELYDEYGIAPIIDKRSDWKDPDATRALFADRVDTIVYDVQGEVSCVCPATGEQRSMAAWGFERDRGTLKYRCPAAAGGYECQGRAACRGASNPYGRVVRIPIQDDRRMFTPVARDSEAWKRAYDRRTSVERVNSRIDQLLGFEHHTIRGRKKMETRMGIALVVLLSIALGRIRAGQRERMRSIRAPAPRAA